MYYLYGSFLQAVNHTIAKYPYTLPHSDQRHLYLPRPALGADGYDKGTIDTDLNTIFNIGLYRLTNGSSLSNNNGVTLGLLRVSYSGGLFMQELFDIAARKTYKRIAGSSREWDTWREW